MRALILLDDAAGGFNFSPGDRYARSASNACYSMGIEVRYVNIVGTGAGTSPTTAELAVRVADWDIDMIILPTLNSNNRVAWGTYSAAVATLGVPMFALSGSDANNAYTFGLASSAANYAGDTATTAGPATIVRTGGTVYTYAQRRLLSTSLVSPIAVYPLIRGQGADVLAVSSWKWTPNGTNFVYYHTLLTGRDCNLLHFLVQEAIYDGLLSAPPIRAPHFLTLDDFNGGGDTHTDGTIGQPQILNNIGDILRAANAVCYVSWERQRVSLMNATQIANFVANRDVLKYVASHDHLTQHLTRNTTNGDALLMQRSKADIDANSYQVTKAAIIAKGCPVDETFAHFAQNSVGTNFYDLAQQATDISADPASAVARAGYGCKFARIEADEKNYHSFPATAAFDLHWMKGRITYRGIVMAPSYDLGAITRGAGADTVEISYTKDFYAFRDALYQSSTGVLPYMHDIDFEDPALNTTPGVLSNGTSTSSRGLLAMQLGATYQSACPHTYNWGADVNDYL